MKKHILLTMAAAMLLAACDDDDKYIEYGTLPATAKSFVVENFSDRKVATVFKDIEFMDSEYEIVFTDGTKINFDKDGVWEEVKARDTLGVPTSIIPTAIKNYIAENNEGKKVVKIGKEHKGFKVIGIGKEDIYYEIELDNKLEMLFDASGNLIRYDD